MAETSILILGGGSAGLSTAWSLGRLGRGDGVTLLEREAELGLHASGRNAQILRTVGDEETGRTLTQRSAAFLREPPAGFAAGPLVDGRGLILAAAGARAEELRREVAAAQPASPARELSRNDLARCFPAYRGAAETAFLFPQEGRIDTPALLSGFARGAREAGVAMRTKTAAAELLVEAGRVAGARLGDGSVLRADTTVLAAGGWAGALGAGAGSRVRLRPTRRHLLATLPTREVDPAWPILWDLNEAFYCRPEEGGLLLCACDQTDADPDLCEPDPATAALILEKASALLDLRLPRSPARFWCGVRTLTEDGRFVVGPDPDVESLFWVAGLGGGGMGAGPEVGRLAAERLAGAPPDSLAETLDPARLAGAMH